MLIDEAGTILAGHGRVAAAQRLGMAEVLCLRLDHMTEDQKRAYVLADNKLALKAGWDEDLLAAGLLTRQAPGDHRPKPLLRLTPRDWWPTRRTHRRPTRPV